MSAIYPVATMALVVVTWLALAIEAHRLLVCFRARHPEVARREIPHAFDQSRHPEKFFYFFRGSARTLLRGDAELSRLSQRVRILTVMAAAVPLGGVIALLIAVVADRLRGTP